jgi:hypothetical protein
MLVTIPARYRGRARRDAAAFYLTQIAKGLLAGQLAVLTDQAATSVVTTEFLVLEIDVQRRKRASHVAVKLRWSNPPGSERTVRGGTAG